MHSLFLSLSLVYSQQLLGHPLIGRVSGEVVPQDSHLSLGPGADIFTQIVQILIFGHAARTIQLYIRINTWGGLCSQPRVVYSKGSRFTEHLICTN